MIETIHNGQPPSDDLLTAQVTNAERHAAQLIRDVMKIQASMENRDYSPHDMDEMLSRLHDMVHAIADKAKQTQRMAKTEIPELLRQYLKDDAGDLEQMSNAAVRKRMTETAMIVEALGSALGLTQQFREVMRQSPLGERFSQIDTLRRGIA